MSIDLGALLSAAGEHCANVNQAGLTTLEGVRALLKQGRYPGELADQVLKLSFGLGEAKVQAAHLESEIVALKKVLDMNETLAARKQRDMCWPQRRKASWSTR